jgi:HNH endonuclease
VPLSGAEQVPHDPHYWSREWREVIRPFVLDRARGRCEIPCCTMPAHSVDHIKARKDGGSDHPSNLRALCKYHHASARENVDRSRKNIMPCDLDGMPTDVNHPWYRPRKP